MKFQYIMALNSVQAPYYDLQNNFSGKFDNVVKINLPMQRITGDCRGLSFETVPFYVV